MIFWAKYNTQTDIRFPLVKRGVVDLAATGDYTPAAADSAISKDGGNLADTTNTVAVISSGTATRGGTVWKLTLSATELQAAEVDVQIVDASVKAIEDQFLTVYTYGNASAKFAGDWSDIVRLGLTALPNAAAEASGGLYTRGSGAGQINQDANGRVDINAKAWLGGTIPAVNVTGVPKVDLVDWLGSAPNALQQGKVDAATVIRANTAAAGASSSITLDASASATDNAYTLDIVTILSGTGAGQTRLISGYVGSTQVASITPSWNTTPDNTSVFLILPFGSANVQRWNNSAIAAPNVAGVPKVDLVDWLGSAPNALISGRTDANAQVVGTGAIVTGSFAANAITAAVINTDAIASAQIAATAVTKIAAGVAALACTEPSAVVAAAPTLIQALSWLLTLSRNLITQTATTQILKADDGTTTIASSTVSDDGTTASRGKFA